MIIIAFPSCLYWFDNHNGYVNIENPRASSLFSIRYLFFVIMKDAYQLALELEKATRRSIESGSPTDVVSSLRRQEFNTI